MLSTTARTAVTDTKFVHVLQLEKEVEGLKSAQVLSASSQDSSQDEEITRLKREVGVENSFNTMFNSLHYKRQCLSQ